MVSTKNGNLINSISYNKHFHLGKWFYIEQNTLYMVKTLHLLQFERDKKSKFDSGALSGGSGEGDLDEFLSDMTPSEFYDDNLMRLIGLPWADFVELIEMDNQGFSLSSRSTSIVSQGMKYS